MKKSNKYYLCLILLLTNNIYLIDSEYSLGIGIDWYNPSLDYWRKDRFIKDYYEGTFEGNLQMSYYVFSPIRIHIGVGYWRIDLQKNYDECNMEHSDLKLRNLTVFLKITADIPLLKKYFHPYAGLGSSMNFIRTTHSGRHIEGENISKYDDGRYNGWHLLVGLEKKYFQKFLKVFSIPIQIW